MKPAQLCKIPATLCAIFGSQCALSATVLPPFETVQNVRAVGMGGATVAVADDESAIFSNPAGIGQEDDPSLTLRGFSIPNLSLGVNAKTYDLFGNMESSTSGLKEVEKILPASENTALYFRGTSFPYITIGRIQLGLLVDAAAEAVQDLGTNAQSVAWDREIQVWQRSQAGLIAGFSVPHRKSGLSAGLTARYTFRTSYFSTITETDNAVTRNETGFNRTRGVALDGGFLFEPMSRYMIIPTVGISVRDIGNTLYRGTGKDDSDEIEKANLMVGATWKLLPGKRGDTQVILTTEGHHLNDTRVADKDKFRVGGEVRFAQRITKAPIALRAGHNLRGFSYGASVNLLLLKLELGSLVEGIQTSSGVYLDRRNFARLSVDLRT
jgi:hypothetical protein